MVKLHWHRQTESGQTAVIFALLLIGLIAFVGLAVDGGHTLNERRVTQNASDASSLAGVHYMEASDAPTEDGLRAKVNSVVEAHGVPDSDGTPGNAINDNIVINYTDEDGDPLENIATCQDGDSLLPCGSIPAHASGLEVRVSNDVETYFLGVIGWNTVNLRGRAVSVVRDSQANPLVAESALYQFGACPSEDIPLDLSLYYSEVIGSVFTNSFFENRGGENHYHGLVTYGEGFTDRADIPGYYEAGHGPGPTDNPDPYTGITVANFDCSQAGGVQGVPADQCYDLTQYVSPGGEINYRVLTQNPPAEDPFLDEATGKLRDGLYYAGNSPIRFGWEPHEGGTVGLHGKVTLVSASTIKITERDVQLTAFLDQDSLLPGLLLFSSYEYSDDPCAPFEEDPQTVPAINTTGNAGTLLPLVYHQDEVNASGPYTNYAVGSLYYEGIIYASRGKVATSGHGASYIGPIVAHTIRVNGYFEFENDDEYECDGEDVACKPLYYPRVSSLFVNDPSLFEDGAPQIFLEE